MFIYDTVHLSDLKHLAEWWWTVDELLAYSSLVLSVLYCTNRHNFKILKSQLASRISCLPSKRQRAPSPNPSQNYGPFTPNSTTPWQRFSKSTTSASPLTQSNLATMSTVPSTSATPTSWAASSATTEVALQADGPARPSPSPSASTAISDTTPRSTCSDASNATGLARL